MSINDVRWVDLQDCRFVDTTLVKWIPHVDVEIIGRIKMILTGRGVAFATFSNPLIPKMVIDGSNPAEINFETPVLTRMVLDGKKPKINFSSDI